MAYVSQSPAVSHGLGRRIAASVESLRRVMARRALRRATFAELSRLSDRELADIGLHRSQIGDVAAEAARTL